MTILKKNAQEGYMSDNFYMNQHFDDFYDMAEALHHWDIEIRQLEHGEINDTIVQLKVNNLYFGHAKFTGKTHQIGQIPPGRTFVFHRGETSKLLWRKKDIPLDGIMIFPLASQLDVVTKGIANTPHSITVPEEILTKRLTPREKETYTQIVSTQDVIIIQKPEMDNLQDTFDKYLQSAEEDPALIHVENFQICLEEELLSALISALFSTQSRDNDILLAKNSTLWEILENHIEMNKHRAIRVSELSKIAEISERSLYRLFHERFGITPKAYLNKLRLNGARLELIQSSIKDIKIMHIANNWGFWHMGQFAADYKDLFGELPSETLESST